MCPDDFGSLVVGGRVGENTWNSRLTEKLREIGYASADFELLFPTLRGIRKPDVTLDSVRGLVVISAKLGERKEVDAIVSAQEYQALLTATGRVADVFAITYPKSRDEGFILRVLANQIHSSVSWKFNTIENAAEKIREVTEEMGEFERDQEPIVTSAIRVLRQGVYDFTFALSSMKSSNFESIFGGKEFFSDVLGYGHSTTHTENILRTAAAYLFVNQIMFYEILSHEIPKEYPPILDSDFTQPSNLKAKYFDKVLEKDYKPIYVFDIANNLTGTRVGDSTAKIIRSIRALFPRSLNHDILGKIFHNLIPLDFRKRVAAYFTNSNAGDLLARLAIDGPDEKVMDPACGSGTLLVSSYKRKLKLSGGVNSEKIHKQYVENDLTGIDVMAFSAHLAAVNLALQAPLYNTDNIRIAIFDSTNLKPGSIIYSARETFKDAFKVRKIEDFDQTIPTDDSGMKSVRGAINLGSGEGNTIGFKSVDVVIMNPPFTSCDNLPAPYKEVLKNRFSTNKSHSSCIVGKVSFQAHFLLLADRFINEGGKIACVIPTTTFTGKHFGRLNKFILTRYTIRCIVTGLGRSAFSDNTSLSEILLVMEKKVPKADHNFILVGTKNSPTEWTDMNVESIYSTIMDTISKQTPLETDGCVTKLCSQKDMVLKKSTLSSYITELERGSHVAIRTINLSLKKSKPITNFKKLLTSGHLTISQYPQMETGKGWPYYGFSALSISRTSDRMAKSTDVLLLNRSTRTSLEVQNRRTKQDFSIPLNFVSPSIRRLSEIKTIDVSNDTDFVIHEDYSSLENIYNSVYNQNDVQTLKKRLVEWKIKVDKCKARMVFARRIDLAASGTRHLALLNDKPMFVIANCWGLTCKDDSHYPIITLWLNSTLILLELLSERSKTRGSFGQIDKIQLESFSMPDLSSIDKNLVDEAQDIFQKISKLDFPSIVNQLETNFSGRTLIDDFVLKTVGISDDEARAKLIVEIQKIALDQLNSMIHAMKQD
jgi:hypothetical protein